MADRTCIVVGGGVAGLAAACAMADAGIRVTVLEKRALLGGRASSFIDPESGDRVDNCQHVTMRCCTNLEAFYRRIGVDGLLRWYDTLTFLDSQGRVSRIHGSFLPAPLHTFPSFARFRSLSVLDKLAVARGLIAILLTRPRPTLDERSMADWLASAGQTTGAVDRFWRPILVSACNEDLDRISCLNGFMIFRDGFLASATAYQMGLPSVTLADLYTEPAVRYIEERGGQVRCKETVDALQVVDGHVTGVRVVGGAAEAADYYLSAVPFDLLLKLLPDEETANPYFANLRNLEYSPITGVHLWFDRHLKFPAAVALLDRQMQWIFDKTEQGTKANGRIQPPASLETQRHGERLDRNTDPEAVPGVLGGSESGLGVLAVETPLTPNAQRPTPTYLGLVVSSARKMAEMPKEEILRIALEEVHECVPGAREAQLVKWRVVKERKATFAPAPGMERWRPAQTSPLPNLFVAGDWTDTGWPATMEGAVRSGNLAAERILEALGAAGTVMAPDLPRSGLCRWILSRPGRR